MSDVPPNLEDWTEIIEHSENKDEDEGEEEYGLTRTWEIDDFRLTADFDEANSKIVVTLEGDNGTTTTNERSLPAPGDVTRKTLYRVTQDMVHRGVGSWGEGPPAIGQE